MKRIFALMLVTALCVTMALTGCAKTDVSPQSQEQPASQEKETPASSEEKPEEATQSTFKPKRNIDWVVTSSPGGGSDIFTRMINDIMVKEGLVDQTILVTNKTDGGGEVGRAAVSQIKAGDQADHTLLTFNSGDLMPMLLNTPNKIENFTPIAIMAVDKQLLFTGPEAKYEDFMSAVEAAKSGTPVVMGGSKGDDVATYEKLIQEVGLTKEQMPYITHDATSDAITAVLGGHIDILISKPAAASQYVEEGVDASKKLKPILALSKERYTGNLSSAPTLSEVGDYADVEVPVWRSVIGPKNMSKEAVQFWSETLKAVSETETWNQDYIEKNMLIANYMPHEPSALYMKEFQEEFLSMQQTK